jgi:hypothetical protein
MASLIENISRKISKAPNGHKLIDSESMNIELQSSNASAVKVNLTDYGYKQAGRHDGDPDALNNHLELIKSGQIIDENSNEEKYKKLRAEIEGEIVELKKVVSEKEADIRNVKESLIPSIEKSY